MAKHRSNCATYLNNSSSLKRQNFDSLKNYNEFVKPQFGAPSGFSSHQDINKGTIVKSPSNIESNSEEGELFESEESEYEEENNFNMLIDRQSRGKYDHQSMTVVDGQRIERRADQTVYDEDNKMIHKTKLEYRLNLS